MILPIFLFKMITPYIYHSSFVEEERCGIAFAFNLRLFYHKNFNFIDLDSNCIYSNLVIGNEK